MPWIEKRPGGYVVRWREGGRNTPAQCTPIITRKDLAKAKAEEIADQVAARGVLRPGVDLSMREILGRWKIAKAARGARDIHLDKAHTRLASLTAAQGWTNTRKITPATVEEWRQAGGSPRGGAMLRAVLRWASETCDQYVDPRAMVALRPRPTKRRPRKELPPAAYVTNWQAKADKASPSAGALVHCLGTYGWRPITAADLVVGDLDLEAGMITTAVKGGDIVRHPLLPATLKRLRPLVADRAKAEPLFLHPETGKAWNPSSSSGFSIVRWCRDYLCMSSYDLKRWAISTMLERKMEPQTVALYTGHRTLSQVLTYARTNEEKARKALAALPVMPVGTSGHRPHRDTPSPLQGPAKNPAKRPVSARRGAAPPGRSDSKSADL